MSRKSVDLALDREGIDLALGSLAERDPRLGEIVARLGPPPVRRRGPGFSTLLRILVDQLVSTRAADAIWQKLVDHLGEPTPATVLAAEDLPGLSGAKKRAARELATAIEEDRLDLLGLGERSDEDVFEAITRLRGFGPWSAHIYLLLALGRPDVWPAGDLAVRVGFAKIFDLDPAPDVRAITAMADPYRPHRSTLALVCWQVYRASDE